MIIGTQNKHHKTNVEIKAYFRPLIFQKVKLADGGMNHIKCPFIVDGAFVAMAPYALDSFLEF
jgi:hypothetical protein